MEGSVQFFWHFVVNEQRIDKVQALCIAAAAILIAIVPASPWTPAPIYVPPREPSSAVSGVAATPLVELTNADRQANQLPPLAINASLQTVAQMKADDMAGKGYFAHVSPDGHSPWYWFQKVGYDYTFAGENLAVDFTDSIDVEKAWMNSTMHRGNILNSHFTEIGIATASGIYQGRVTTFVVEEFASPAIEPTALPPAPAPAKSSDSANRGAAPREISDEAQSAAAPLAPKIDFLSAWRL